MTIGVLALQGGFARHNEMLERIGVSVQEVRLPDDLNAADGLIIPGGESTTIIKLMNINGITGLLYEKARSGFPIFGTCAGLILLARSIDNFEEQETLALLDVTIVRNYYGRQLSSFEANISSDFFEDRPFRGIFIRAPKITGKGDNVQVIAKYGDDPVFVRQQNIFGASFHPELTDDLRIHEFFVAAVKSVKGLE